MNLGMFEMNIVMLILDNEFFFFIQLNLNG